MLLLVGWKLAQPWLPPDPQRHHFPPPRVVWIADDLRPLQAVGDPSTADILFLGDSRIHQAIERGPIELAGLGRCAVLGRGGAQLDELLLAPRRFPARRVVVALSPLSLYTDQAQGLGLWQRGWSRDGFERTLDLWTNSLQNRLVRTVNPRDWDTSWFARPEPNASTANYQRRLDRRTQPQRSQGLREAFELLHGLREDGWDVLCIRLPISEQLLAVEQDLFGGWQFETLCRRARVGYLDFTSLSYPTVDGSHLTAAGATAFSEHLARRLRIETGWGEGGR